MTGQRVSIRLDSDVDIARIRTYRFAIDEGLTNVEATALATAVSELARNVIAHAWQGELALSVDAEGDRQSIVAVVCDEGPGIREIERAMQDGYSTKGTLGLGLPSARRLLDELDVVSVAGVGTTATAKKWKPRRTLRDP